MNKNVLLVGSNRTTKGGIASVLRMWMDMPLFQGGRSTWLEIQSNVDKRDKVKCLLLGYLKMLWQVPMHRVIHFHSTPGNCVWIHMPVLLWSKLCGKKILIHLHVGNQIENYKHSKLFRFFLHRADKVVVLAKVWEAKVAELDIPRERITTIYNPSPEVVKNSEREKYVLFMAFINKNKGYDILVNAFAKIAKEFPEWRLEMAGTGATDIIRQIAKENDIESQVNVHEWVGGNEKEELFRKASAYCMASYMEGFPMSVLEGYAYGVPLISTPVGGIVDVLKDGENALVFAFGSVEQLTEKLRLLFTDTELRDRLSAASYELAEKVFSPKQVEASLEKLYNEL